METTATSIYDADLFELTPVTGSGDCGWSLSRRSVAIQVLVFEFSVLRTVLFFSVLPFSFSCDDSLGYHEAALLRELVDH